MASALPTAQRLAVRLARGDAEGLVGEDLDALLRWLADAADGDAAPLERALRERALEPERARRVAYHALDRKLFAPGEPAPHRVLGLGRDAGGPALRDRYRLLMRVYHPDLGVGSPEWLGDRAARINEAYRRLRGSREEPAALASMPAAASSGPSRRPRRRRDRARPAGSLGSAHDLRRRALLGLVAVGTALVAHTFVANQAWRQPADEAGGAAAAQVDAP